MEVAVSGPLIANDFARRGNRRHAAGPVTAGQLVHLLERFAPMTGGVLLYYPGRWQVLPKLRAFNDQQNSHSFQLEVLLIHKWSVEL